ncbi:MAG: hypothetical protein EZS28_043558, partial [Streblomastix strix]
QKNYKKQSSRELISKPVVADQFQSQTDLDTDKTQDQQKDQQKNKSDFQQQQSTTSVTPPSSHSPVFAEIGVDTSSLEPAFILDETTGEEILASPLSLTQTQRDSDYQSLYSLSQTKRGGSNSPQLQIYQQQGNSVLTQTSNSSTQRGKKQKIGEMRVNASTDTDSLMSRRLQMVNTTTSMEEIQFSEIGVQYSDEQSLTPKSRDVSVWTTKELTESYDRELIMKHKRLMEKKDHADTQFRLKLNDAEEENEKKKQKQLELENQQKQLLEEDRKRKMQEALDLEKQKFGSHSFATHEASTNTSISIQPNSLEEQNQIFWLNSRQWEYLTNPGNEEGNKINNLSQNLNEYRSVSIAATAANGGTLDEEIGGD